MAKIPEYHTNTDPEDPVYHVYDDCPAGKQVIAEETTWKERAASSFVLSARPRTAPGASRPPTSVGRSHTTPVQSGNTTS